MNKGQSKGQEPGQAAPPTGNTSGARWLPAAAWVVACLTVLLAIYLGWRVVRPSSSGTAATLLEAGKPSVKMPVETPGNLGGDTPNGQQPGEALAPNADPFAAAIDRRSELRTIIPERSNEAVREYTVVKGDSVFEIAAKFGIKPETLLWANYAQLNDNPDMISLGMNLSIPPVDGVLYAWKAGDSLPGIAGQFKASPEDILSWPGNNIDLTNQMIEPGALIMIPNGEREFRQWIIPTIARGQAGVSQSVYGGGACEGGYDGAYGSGAFIWPAGNHVLSGNDYWDGHLAIDIAAGEGAPVYAADSGVVVFAGWATGGYGNMVMIDHGNGYQTLYSHLSSVKIGCGQSISQGSTIGFSGSTGNSTGAHLHFEVRYQGGFVNPWYVLPAP